MQISGLLILCAGLAVLRVWVGIAVLGAGLIAIGIATELG